MPQAPYEPVAWDTIVAPWLDKRWDYKQRVERKGRVRAKIITYQIVPEDRGYPVLAHTPSEALAARIVDDHNKGVKDVP